MQLRLGWSDQLFDINGSGVNSSSWRLVYINATLPAISGGGGVLNITGITIPVASGGTYTTVGALRSNGLNIDISRYTVVSVWVRTPIRGVEARIILFSAAGNNVTIWDQSFPDTGWHDIVTDLKQYFGGTLTAIELSWILFTPITAAYWVAEFRNLSLYEIVPS